MGRHVITSAGPDSQPLAVGDKVVIRFERHRDSVLEDSEEYLTMLRHAAESESE